MPRKLKTTSLDRTYATPSDVATAVSNLVNSAPAALDTLNELATALGNDANFSTTVTNSLATKAPLQEPSFTGQYVRFPAGTTAQRPASPTVGMTRYNTDIVAVETYHGAIRGWQSLSNVLQATGGTITDIGGYRYHTFYSSGQFVVTGGTGTFDYLIVAGGGGGATDEDVGGAGGGGGLITGTGTLYPSSFSITVGAGGAGGTTAYTPGTGAGGNGAQGGSSSAFGLTAIGGGYGGTRGQAGGSGGSGGGGGDFPGGGGGAGTSGQGYAGGTAAPGNSNGGQDRGSGGGAGGAATNGSSSAPSIPGPGLFVTFANGTYSAGGDQRVYNTPGTVNTGNGGQNRAGGSGIVVIRYSLSV